MRLDPSYLHFISREQMRILAAIQMGMRNHQYVSAELITKIGNLRGGQTYKTIQKLLKNKFIVHIGNKCDGYKLTFLGYDYLAIQTFMKRGLIKDVLCKIGVGKQSDIYKCTNPQGEFIVLKLTRLGRNSFRSIKKNREYIQHRTNYNWLYLSRLSSMRQFLFMQMLYQQKFPTPKPIDTNRHAILMSLVDGDTLCHIQRMTSQQTIKNVFEMCSQLLVKFAKCGLIHGDFNEFNLMVNQQGTKLTVIDFPQCISANHPNANHYFNRDVECIYKYFNKLAEKSYQQNVRDSQQGDLNKDFKLNVSDYPLPVLGQIQFQRRLDHEIKVRGHISLQEYNQLQKYRTQEQRIKAQMQGFSGSQSQEDENEEQQKEEGADQQQQQQIQKKQVDQQINIEDNFLQLEGVEKHKEVFKYDVQLENLIANMEQQHIDPKEAQNHEEEESSQQEQRFKGMTPYEIRIKIKEQKRIERQKKKQAVNTEDYIKKALRKGNTHKVYNGRGNHGKKDKQKQNNFAIKENMY